MSSSSEWVWSPVHNDYYRVTLDRNGQPVYDWAKVAGQVPTVQLITSQVAQPEDSRNDSPVEAEAEPPAPVPPETRAVLPNFVAGTPQTGWLDRLDPRPQARQFFKKGRVFAMLYTEPTGETAWYDPGNDAHTTVRFGKSVYTQIRRFVAVSVRKSFVYACPISTYGRQGTLKRGCNPGEHAVICNTHVNPRRCYLQGEHIYKEAIQVEPPNPADEDSYLSQLTRLRFGKTYAIEWNVKVKDLGMVVPEDMPKLRQYYEDEDREFE